uniref:NADH-ubiquinone oxidoreductase chain 4L n=1 Tax=Pliacanthopus bimaculatus TaxID=2775419 RepID=A0A7L8EYW0_9NEOP|nr:NADH dehydrogenase subunit 4L [Pliacanthopus bimaculatus]ASY97908.1 NADH dehydrogenase subunit 4L [Miromantis yunnanensis]QOE17729.1 NADH dehydrogenase subunit 4L [Pliacanthopus bimaculatus]
MLMMFYFMFFCGLWSFSSKRKHLLVTLLSLEFIVLILFIMLYCYVVMVYSELYLTMFFMSFAVCEGALGLSILVAMIRTHGNDYFTSFGLLQC